MSQPTVDRCEYIYATTGEELADKINEWKRDHYVYATTIKVTSLVIDGVPNVTYHCWLFHRGVKV